MSDYINNKVMLQHISGTLQEFLDKFLMHHAYGEFNDTALRSHVLKLMDMYQFLYQIDSDYRFVFQCDAHNNVEDVIERNALVIDIHVYGPKKDDGTDTVYTGHLETYHVEIFRRGLSFEALL